MARSGLTKLQVRTVRDRLVADGRYPSVDAVRHALGDSGSKSTIHKHLKELRDEDAGAGIGIQRADTEQALQAVVAQLADRLHTQVEDRIRTLQAAHAAALHARDSEIAALHATVALLNARLQQLDAPQTPADALLDASTDTWRAPRQVPANDGFGRFDSALFSTRADNRAASPFNMIRALARS
jgi:Arc/MetJ-type ribon-helix-helix transcriptional regulator